MMEIVKGKKERKKKTRELVHEKMFHAIEDLGDDILSSSLAGQGPPRQERYLTCLDWWRCRCAPQSDIFY